MTRREALSVAFAVRLPRKVRVAIVGLEGHTSEITGPMKDLPDTELAAYAADQPGKFDAKHYTDYRLMLDREKPDVVAVTTDDGARAEAILECIARKIHVVAEKPLAIARADYERVKKATLASGIKLGMLLPTRYTPQFLAMRAIVDSGAIGEVAQIQGQKSYKPGPESQWKNREASYSGTIPWVGIHMIDTMLFASRRRFVECAAFQSLVGWPELGARENTASIVYRLDNRGTATLNCDYLRPGPVPSHGDDRLRIAGTKGVVEYQASTGVTLMTLGQAPRAVELPRARSLFVDYLTWVYNSGPATLPHEDIWAASEAAYAARESAKTGRIVKI